MADTPVRIALCITELDPGGAERALVRIVAGLDRSRWSPHVYCLAGSGPLTAELEAADVPVTCLGARSWRNLSIIGRLTRQLRNFRPTILQTFLFHANIAGRLAARRANVPIVISGARVVEPDARWRMRLDRWTSGLIDHIICVSRGVADQYRSLGFRDDQLTVVPNGVDVDRFATAEPADLTRFDIPPQARTVISVGRLHPQKGQGYLISAFHRLRNISRRHQDVHLLFVGDGPDRAELVASIQRLGLAENVHFAGWQPDVGAILRAADVFVLSSVWEGMPNVLLEAMAAGLPCVATNVEGVAELVMDEQTGLLVEPCQHRALSDALHRLLDDAALAARLAAAGQQRVREHFTWENTIRGFETVWKQLLESSP